MVLGEGIRVPALGESGYGDPVDPTARPSGVPVSGAVESAEADLLFVPNFRKREGAVPSRKHDGITARRATAGSPASTDAGMPEHRFIAEGVDVGEGNFVYLWRTKYARFVRAVRFGPV